MIKYVLCPREGQTQKYIENITDSSEVFFIQTSLHLHSEETASEQTIRNIHLGTCISINQRGSFRSYKSFTFNSP